MIIDLRQKLEKAKDFASNNQYYEGRKFLEEFIFECEVRIDDYKLNGGTCFVKRIEDLIKQAKQILVDFKRLRITGVQPNNPVSKPIEQKPEEIVIPKKVNSEVVVKDEVFEENEVNIQEPIKEQEKSEEVYIQEQSNTYETKVEPQTFKEEPVYQEQNQPPKIIPSLKPNIPSMPSVPIRSTTFSLPEVTGNIMIQLGNKTNGEVIFWEPKNQANQHLVAVGMSGTGKTTALRTILYQLEQQKVPLVIFDLHDDFSAQKSINFGEITINPLELDGLTPKEKAIEFAYICKRIFQLGDQQENKLREAILYCYGQNGIDIYKPETFSNPAPTLKDVSDFLEDNRDGKTVDTLLGRVKFFHRVELFMSETRCPFKEIFKGSTVIKLIEFSDNPELQMALCEIFLNKLLFTVKKAGQSKLRAYCVIDEAHILDDGKDSYRSPLVKIAREARKYGLGLILASQRPRDFSKSVLHNAATIMTLKFNAKEEARAISDHMFGVNDIDILNLGEVGRGFVKFNNEVSKIKFFQIEDLIK